MMMRMMVMDRIVSSSVKPASFLCLLSSENMGLYPLIVKDCQSPHGVVLGVKISVILTTLFNNGWLFTSVPAPIGVAVTVTCFA